MRQLVRERASNACARLWWTAEASVDLDGQPNPLQSRARSPSIESRIDPTCFAFISPALPALANSSAGNITAYNRFLSDPASQYTDRMAAYTRALTACGSLFAPSIKFKGNWFYG
jgi:hypothetical protein